MIHDISGLTLAAVCDEYSPEQVVEYARDWCRHEADNLVKEHTDKASGLVDFNYTDEITRLRVLASRLNNVVEV